jgi:SAM-dependent methyltransferase
MQTSTQSCPICGGAEQIRPHRQPGYLEGSEYEVAYCAQCDSSHAVPLLVDSGIYDLIYAQRAKVRGYDRYERYAEDVLRCREPISYLTRVEDVYWAVWEGLNKSVGNVGGKQIIEIGSGLGYLTYALRKAGLNARGVELSSTAVATATARYGPLFVCGRVEEYVAQNPSAYDVVICTEVIEHVVDPRAFFCALVGLLKVGGSLILTTQNKSIYSNKALWETDPPPVHLWWLSEITMDVLGRQFGCDLRLIDFTSFNGGHYQAITNRANAETPSRFARLDRSGKARRETLARRSLKAILRNAGLIPLLRRLRALGRDDVVMLRDRSHSLCGVFTRRQAPA